MKTADAFATPPSEQPLFVAQTLSPPQTCHAIRSVIPIRAAVPAQRKMPMPQVVWIGMYHVHTDTENVGKK